MTEIVKKERNNKIQKQNIWLLGGQINTQLYFTTNVVAKKENKKTELN